MAAATRHDDQGNVIHIGEEGAEGEEGEYHDTEGRGIGDDRGQSVPDPHDPLDPHHGGACGHKNPDLAYGGHCRCHPLDPLPPNPMDLLGNLVDALCDTGLQANPGHRCRFQQVLQRHAQGGILPDPNLNSDLDSDDDDTPQVKIPPPIFKGLPGERPDTHIYAAEDWMEAMCFRENQYIDKFKQTLNHLAR